MLAFSKISKVSSIFTMISSFSDDETTPFFEFFSTAAALVSCDPPVPLGFLPIFDLRFSFIDEVFLVNFKYGCNIQDDEEWGGSGINGSAATRVGDEVDGVCGHGWSSWDLWIDC